MAIVVPNVSEESLLNILLGIDSQPSEYVYRLFTNDATVNESSTLGSFTELSSGLYTPLEIEAADWTVSESGGITSAMRALYEWEIDDSATLYGYFVTNTMPDTLYWCEKFSSPIAIPSGGGTLNFTAKLSLD